MTYLKYDINYICQANAILYLYSAIMMPPQTHLTHWGRVMHICVGKLSIIGSDNGLSPGRRQASIWTNAGMLLIEPLWTNFSEILIEILTFSFKKMRLKVLSAKWRPFCLGLNVLPVMSLNNRFLLSWKLPINWGKPQKWIFNINLQSATISYEIL